MNKLITALAIALVATTGQAAMLRTADAETDMMDTLSRISPARHAAIKHIAAQCKLSPQRSNVLSLLTAPGFNDVVAGLAQGRSPAVSAEVCASLSQASV